MELKGSVNAGYRSEHEDVLHYLKVYKIGRDRLLEKADKVNEAESLVQAEIIRYQEAVKNCEAAENRYKKMEDELNDIRRKYIEGMKNDPLTWDELCRIDMIGEPIWNEGTRRWMLLIDSANDGSWIDLVNHAGGKERWIGHDARKFPLYRMRK